MTLQNSAGTCTHTPGAGSESVSCSSDIRLKKDIAPAPSALDWLSNIAVKQYTVRSTGERTEGVIAQEMLIYHPEMVHTDSKGIYNVDQPNPWVLVKAIQELKADNDNLRHEINVLKKTLIRKHKK
jgi:hypothetical protein